MVNVTCSEADIEKASFKIVTRVSVYRALLVNAIALGIRHIMVGTLEWNIFLCDYFTTINMRIIVHCVMGTR